MKYADKKGKAVIEKRLVVTSHANI